MLACYSTRIVSNFRFMKQLTTYFFFFALLLWVSGCASGPEYAKDSDPEVGPVAAALDGSIDADPLAAEIDLSNEAAGDATEDFTY